MKLNKVSLENFRNYKKISIDIGADLVLILGENAAGKTNFLEAIFYLSALRSFRSPDNLLVKQGEDFFRINAQADGKSLEAIAQINPAVKRQCKIDGLKVTRTAWKSFGNVLFVPPDLNLFTFGPTLRRKFLDETLSQVFKDYGADLVSLDHVLKQRASLFERIYKQEAAVSDLEIWDEQLAELSARIVKRRQDFVNFLQKKFGEVYAMLTDFKNEFKVEYKRCAQDKEEFLNHLVNLRDAEIRSSTNLLGPHREDFIIEKDGTLNIYNSSRGELRAQILTLKLLQAEFLDQNGVTPVILLDDVFSELDETRRTRLIETLSRFQIFITSTEEHHLPKLKQNSQILKVENNEII